MKFNCPYTSITQPIWAVVLNMLSFWLPNKLSRSKISFFLLKYKVSSLVYCCEFKICLPWFRQKVVWYKDAVCGLWCVVHGPGYVFASACVSVVKPVCYFSCCIFRAPTAPGIALGGSPGPQSPCYEVSGASRRGHLFRFRFFGLPRGTKLSQSGRTYHIHV